LIVVPIHHGGNGKSVPESGDFTSVSILLAELETEERERATLPPTVQRDKPAHQPDQ